MVPCTKELGAGKGEGLSTKCQGKRGVSRNQVTLAGWAKDEQRTPKRSSLGEMDGNPMEPGILEAGEAGSFSWKHLGNCWGFLFVWVGEVRCFGLDLVGSTGWEF